MSLQVVIPVVIAIVAGIASYLINREVVTAVGAFIFAIPFGIFLMKACDKQTLNRAQWAGGTITAGIFMILAILKNWLLSF